MVQMNLFAEQEYRCRCREWTCGHGLGMGRVGWIEKVALTYTYYHIDHNAGMDRGQEEKGTTEDEMAGWHPDSDGCESEWTPAVGDGQGGLACCDSWGRKESDMTERLIWTELYSKELAGSCRIAQGAQLSAPWCPREVGWGEGPWGTEYMYTCGWFTLFYCRN